MIQVITYVRVYECTAVYIVYNYNKLYKKIMFIRTQKCMYIFCDDCKNRLLM